MCTKLHNFQNVIGNVKDASPSDYVKICSMYKWSKCMGKRFNSANHKSGHKKGRNGSKDGKRKEIRRKGKDKSNAPLSFG